VRIGITGKYAALRDAYASIDKALEHGAAHLSAQLETVWVDTVALSPADAAAAIAGLDAVIVPGGFGQRGTEGKIACIRQARMHGIPFLGICFGFQMAVIEFARHVCNLAGASSTEFDPTTPHPVIDILPEQKKIEGLGGNMRLGGKDVAIQAGTLAARLFDNRALVRQRFRHRYEVDPRYIGQLESRGLIFSGRHPQQPIMQVLELPFKTHPYFVAAQFHPELLSRPLHPHPMFMGLIAAAIRHAHPSVPIDQISSRWLPQAADPAATVGQGV
jgi:CTP synthase